MLGGIDVHVVGETWADWSGSVDPSLLLYDRVVYIGGVCRRGEAHAEVHAELGEFAVIPEIDSCGE